MYKRQTNNCPLIFCASGRARWCSNKAVPSVWISRENVKWHDDEKYFERERMIEMVTLSRSYKELRERLKFEKIDDMKYLPVVVEIDDYLDDTTVDDKHLPGDNE